MVENSSFLIMVLKGSSLVLSAYEDSPRRMPRMRTHVPNEQGDPTDSYFIHTIVPVHDATSKVEGVVIYTETVSEGEAK